MLLGLIYISDASPIFSFLISKSFSKPKPGYCQLHQDLPPYVEQIKWTRCSEAVLKLSKVWLAAHFNCSGRALPAGRSGADSEGDDTCGPSESHLRVGPSLAGMMVSS